MKFQPGVLAALASAFLFGAGTPLAKWLLGQMSPWMLAGLLYLEERREGKSVDQV